MSVNNMALQFYAYVDGSCSRNGDANASAGAAAIFVAVNDAGEVVRERECAWPVPGKPNSNRAEVAAVVFALQELKFPSTITIVTDSNYVLGRMVNRGRSRIDQDMWDALDALRKVHTVRWRKVKAHHDNEYNNRVDKLARRIAKA
jgi:ribonuclease HI